MLARTCSGRARSRSKGPPGARRMMKKDSDTMMKRTGRNPATLRATKPSTDGSPLDADVLQRMLVQDVRVPALHLRVQHALVHVREEREHGRLIQQDRLRRLH